MAYQLTSSLPKLATFSNYTVKVFKHWSKATVKLPCSIRANLITLVNLVRRTKTVLMETNFQFKISLIDMRKGSKWPAGEILKINENELRFPRLSYSLHHCWLLSMMMGGWHDCPRSRGLPSSKDPNNFPLDLMIQDLSSCLVSAKRLKSCQLGQIYRRLLVKMPEFDRLNQHE